MWRILPPTRPAACRRLTAASLWVFTVDGTTLNGDGVHPTGLNYLKRLGVTHVQLQPIFDFATVDEVERRGLQLGV